jgi:glyoxylase-like metal-dependent hydrolase (beta-lactamase superfamily II)
LLNNRSRPTRPTERIIVVFLAVVEADAFGTNCFVVAPAAGEQCVVVDPGIGVLERLDDLLAQHRLSPAAVLVTHGHLDHTFSVAPVCDARGVTAYIHPEDRALLADPAMGLSTPMNQILGPGLRYTEPDDVAPLADGQVITVAGMEITVDHAPGHTRGEVMFRIPTGDSAGSVEADQLCLSGDVLFAGSIGRTDLPGGDTATMMRSLRDKVLTLPDDTLVLPGHGPVTTIGRERAANPFLRELVETRP